MSSASGSEDDGPLFPKANLVRDIIDRRGSKIPNNDPPPKKVVIRDEPPKGRPHLQLAGQFHTATSVVTGYLASSLGYNNNLDAVMDTSDQMDKNVQRATTKIHGKTSGVIGIIDARKVLGKTTIGTGYLDFSSKNNYLKTKSNYQAPAQVIKYLGNIGVKAASVLVTPSSGRTVIGIQILFLGAFLVPHGLPRQAKDSPVLFRNDVVFRGTMPIKLSPDEDYRSLCGVFRTGPDLPPVCPATILAPGELPTLNIHNPILVWFSDVLIATAMTPVASKAFSTLVQREPHKLWKTADIWQPLEPIFSN